MKKIILSIALSLLAITSFAEQKVGSYTSLGKEWDIEAEYKNNSLTVYIELIPKYKSDKVFLALKGEGTIEDFQMALQLCKAKYIEWSEVGVKNNIKEYSKMIDVSFPNCEIYWKGGDKWYSTYKKDHVKMMFMISEGESSIGSMGEAQDWENEYIEQTWYMMLNSVGEIEKLCKAIDPKEIIKQFKIQNDTDSLFK